MGELIFTFCYGGALVIMGLITKWYLNRQQKDSSVDMNSQNEEETI
ncbi:hypothetical protein [Oceanobacillus halotolerans]|nr:hypothetical protein [Oceanobacillus halotolerans]